MLLADFEVFEDVLRSLIREMYSLKIKSLGKPYHAFVQIMEIIEGGLSQIEKRAWVDSLQHSGALLFKIAVDNKSISNEEALQRIKKLRKIATINDAFIE
ncbi:hypothetical protein EP331_13065 [bacterium]|nr:MAG: hypothetical protein EP331_13065 [bacterium]